LSIIAIAIITKNAILSIIAIAIIVKMPFCPLLQLQ
jgi:hypothetical protein